MVMPILFHELFWNPSCTDFMEVKFVLDDFIHRNMTNLQLVCHFTDSHPATVENQNMDLTIVLFRCQCGLLPTSLSVTTVQPLLDMSVNSYMLHCSKHCYHTLLIVFNEVPHL